MQKRVVLNRHDEVLIDDICNYILMLDKEKEDFIEHYGCDWFNEHDVLELHEVDSKAKCHIYYKVEYIRQNLIIETHGN